MYLFSKNPFSSLPFGRSCNESIRSRTFGEVCSWCLASSVFQKVSRKPRLHKWVFPNRLTCQFSKRFSQSQFQASKTSLFTLKPYSVYAPFDQFGIPDFLNLQRLSFQNFLKKGLIAEFQKLKPFQNVNRTFELCLHADHYKLLPCKWTPKQAILQRKSYTSGLFIPVKFSNPTTEEIQLQWVLLAHLPLMTKQGHFIINGCPRVLMNQQVRSPGVYFKKIEKADRDVVYCADFIAQRGSWLRLEVENQKGEIWAKFKRTPKLSVFQFMTALGLPLPIFHQGFDFEKLRSFFPLKQTRHTSPLQRDTLEVLSHSVKGSELETQWEKYQSAVYNRQVSKWIVYCKDLEVFLKRRRNYGKRWEEVRQTFPTTFLERMKKEKFIFGTRLVQNPLKPQAPRQKAWKSEESSWFWHTYFESLEELATTLYPPNIENPELKNTETSRNSKLEKESESTPEDETRHKAEFFLFRKFQNPRTYDLSVLGRERINQKLGLTISEDHTLLTVYDIFFACVRLIDLLEGRVSADDIDDLTNRQIHSSGDLVQKQLANGLLRLEKSLRSKLNQLQPTSVTPSTSSFFTLKPIHQCFREFFGTNPLSQFMDQTNPLAELTHKRRLSSLGPGGMNRETAGMAIRGIHPTHYGRICPIETPEGKNAGLVNSFTIYATLTSKGWIETPFYKTYKGLILKKNPVFLSSIQETEKILAPGDLPTSKFHFLPSVSVPVRKQAEFQTASREAIHFTSVSPLQMISVATALIPFLEHNDGNRALMGSNMQRQSVPTLRPVKPIVGTGLESRVMSDIGQCLQAPRSGFVSVVDSHKICIYSKPVGSFPFSKSKDSFSSLTVQNSRRFGANSNETLWNSDFLNFLGASSGPGLSFQKRLVKLAKVPISNCKRPIPLLGLKTQKSTWLATQNFIKSSNQRNLSPCWTKVDKETGDQESSDVHFFKKSLFNRSFKVTQESSGNALFQFEFHSGFSLVPFQTPNQKKDLKRQALHFIYAQLYFNDFFGQLNVLKTRVFAGLNPFCVPKDLQKLEQSGSISVLFNRPEEVSKKLFSKRVLKSLGSSSHINGLAYICQKQLNQTSYSPFSVKPFNSNLQRQPTQAPRNLEPNSLSSFQRQDFQKAFFETGWNWKAIRGPLSGNMATFPPSGTKSKADSVSKLTQQAKRAASFEPLFFKELPSVSVFYPELRQTIFEKFQTSSVNRTFQTTKPKQMSYSPGTLSILSTVKKKQWKPSETQTWFFIGCLNFCRKTFDLPSSGPKDNWNGNATLLFLKWINFPQSKLFSTQFRSSFQVLNVLFPSSGPSKDQTVKGFETSYSPFSTFKKDLHPPSKTWMTSLLPVPMFDETEKTRVDKTLEQFSGDFKAPSFQKSQSLKGLTPEKDLNATSLTLLSQPWVPYSYTLENYQRSNQGTFQVERPLVQEGQWVEQGDALTENSGSVQGELAIGQNLFVGYIPWEGYNFEDAVLISERVGVEDLFTSLHIDRYEVKVKDTELGFERITNWLPNRSAPLSYLDERGIAKLGTWVEEGDVLVGKVAPYEPHLTPYEKFLYAILEKEAPKTKDTSLRVPKGVKGRVIHVEVLEASDNLKETDKPLSLTSESFTTPILKSQKSVPGIPLVDVVQTSSFLKFFRPTENKKLPFRLTSGNRKSFLNSSVPWFQPRRDSSVSKRICLRPFKGQRTPWLSQPKYPKEIRQTKTLPLVTSQLSNQETKRFQKQEAIHQTIFRCKFLKLIKNTSNKLHPGISTEWVSKVLKSRRKVFQTSGSLATCLAGLANQLKGGSEAANGKTRFSNVHFPTRLSGQTIEESANPPAATRARQVFPKSFKKPSPSNRANLPSLKKVHVYIAEKRKLQVGDKIAGRHGNKGIISKILPRHDMPYLPDGTPLDIVLNPLGVPSRMNVGQIFECLLGLAGYYLKQNYKIQPFDELYGSEASRSLVYSKLYEARVKTGQDWLFNPNFPGKTRLFDGRTGECFDQPVTVGVAYILKLIHLVDEKIHARSTGPYSLVTQQPLRGRSKMGGQRVGEMEVWSFEGFGAAYSLQEILTYKSDDLKGREQVFNSILTKQPFCIGVPESFKVLIRELQALCLDMDILKTRHMVGQNVRFQTNLNQLQTL